ncbi:TetR/AcrR family transcriptional regulator [Nonomuraea sp. NPDC003754]
MLGSTCLTWTLPHHLPAGAGPHPPTCPVDDLDLRLVLALNHLIDIVLGRYLFKAPSPTECDLDTLIALVAPAVQNYLTSPLPTASANQPAKRLRPRITPLPPATFASGAGTLGAGPVNEASAVVSWPV